MTIETETAALTTSVNNLITQTGIKKLVLDAAVTDADSATASALASRNTANNLAGQSSGSAAAAMATYNATLAEQTAVNTAQAQASLAAGLAGSASTIVQQDLSAVNVAALHRSPNAVTSVFVYDTGKDTDGGAWTEKCQNTSWYNEAITGKWLGAQFNETYARYSGATVGAELITNGTFGDGVNGWTAGTYGASTISANNNVLRVTESGVSGNPSAGQNFVVTSGKTYRVTFDVVSLSGSNGMACWVGSSYGSANWLYTNITFGPSYVGKATFYFTAATARAYFEFIGYTTAGGTDQYFEVANVSVKEVTALTTTSNDYFQLTTDGKFYRLWKNLLEQSVDLTKAVNAETAAATLTANTIVFTAPTAYASMGTNVGFSGLAGQTFTASVTLSSPNGKASVGLWAKVFGNKGATGKTVQLTTTPTRHTISVTATGSFSSGIEATLDNRTAFNGDGTTSGTIVATDWQVEYDTIATDYEPKNSQASITEVFRGNKRDFPRLAGIVVEAANVNIYDLTEPGRPMWMRFILNGTVFGNSSLLGRTGQTKAAVCALNNVLAIGNGTSYAESLQVINFLSDAAVNYSTGIYSFIWNGNISQRNDLRGVITATLPNIASAINIFSIAMTVLPNAPTDPVTGLKVPTIAVATGGGVSLIRDDGTVKNSDLTNAAWHVTFDPDNLHLWAIQTATPYSFFRYSLKTMLYSDASAKVYYNTYPYIDNPSNTRQLVVKNIDRFSVSSPAQGFFNVIEGEYVNLQTHKDLLSQTTSSYNTGWMPGDIKGTFLASKDTTSLVGSGELVTNGTFATNDLTGWTNNSIGTAVPDASTGVAVLQRIDSSNIAVITQAITTVVGATYRISGVVTGGPMYVQVGTTLLGAQLLNANSTTSFVFNFVATGTTSYITHSSAGNGVSPTIDNVSVKLADADRSVNAKGLIVNGTVTRTPVATGAELVGYSGFSATNYLEQPYNSGLDFGTGDFCVMGWGKRSLLGSGCILISKSPPGGAFGSPYFELQPTGSSITWVGNTASTKLTSVSPFSTNWMHIAFVRVSGVAYLYINGRVEASSVNTENYNHSNNDILRFGTRQDGYIGVANQSMALWRISATAPTADQVRQIYEDEKQLFRAGAACTLPDSTSILDLSYDDTTNSLVTTSATNKSYWSGLVRTGVTPVPAGTYSKTKVTSGIELSSRISTNPGVDVTIPAYMLREELNKNSETASKTIKDLVMFDYVGGFTASTTNGSTSITSVANLSYPTSYIGARISGTGIPANTTIIGVSGTTITLSAAATATATGVSITFLDFMLPIGFSAKAAYTAGIEKREGATSDYTRLFDGFLETIRFAVAPGVTTWVQIQAVRR